MTAPVLLTPKQAMAVLNVGKTRLFQLIALGPENGGIESVKPSPQKRLIPMEACEDYARRLRAQAAQDRSIA